MGVYHFMGLGRSVGAVTAALSYLAARFERDDAGDREFFNDSGEMAQSPDKKRGDLQALVFFTTPEVHSGAQAALSFVDNRPGRKGGKRNDGLIAPHALRRYLKSPIRVLTEASREQKEAMRRKEIEVYWCEIERNRPTETFERAVQVMAAAKGVGREGKEVWINFTGGTNIINSGLQLSASLLGVSARLYYILTDDTDHLYHTIPLKKIGTKSDTFWVDLPIVYMNFDRQHRRILDELDERGDKALTLQELYERVIDGFIFEQPPGANPQERLAWFRRLYLRPLRSQRLLSPNDNTIQLGPEWQRLQRYHAVLPDFQGDVPGLGELARQKAWFFAEKWPVTD